MASSLEMVFRKARSAEKRGDAAEARRLFEDVLKTYPKNVTAQQGLARLNGGAPGGGAPEGEDRGGQIDRLIAAHARGDHAETIRLGGALTRHDPSLAGVRTLTGAARLATGAYAEAEADFRAEILAQPDNAGHHIHLGIALIGLARYDAAETALDAALRLEPDSIDALFNMALAHEGRERFDAAIAACRAVTAIAPDHLGALHKIGCLQARAGCHADAAKSFLEVLTIAPEHVSALLELGRSMTALSQLDEALKAFRLAARLAPDSADAHNSLGLTLTAMRRIEDAIVAFAHAAGIEPENYGIWARLLSLQAYICDWSNRPLLARLPLDVENGSVPFDALTFEDEPYRQLRRSEAYVRRNLADIAMSFVAPAPRRAGKIRIGYFSADFHKHPVYYLIAGMLRVHDRERFEIYCFDFSPLGVAGAALADHVDGHISIRDVGGTAALDLIRGYELDIAVDLMGYTGNARSALFAARLAPVQINYLGFPGSMALPTMDYIIGDPVLIPPALEDAYSEKIIRLPGSYQPNDNRNAVVDEGDTRATHGLPEGFVFCCFNQNYKISPAEFDIWMRLLREVEGSVLWFRSFNEVADGNLRREAEARGVDPARLIFAQRVSSHRQHIARLRHADLFLDTFCYNAHTTASDALWSGVPVLTLVGRQFAARVGASLVAAIGMPDMMTFDEQGYYEKALEIARCPALAAELRARVAANRATHPLYDTIGYTRAIEDAYRQAHERCIAGLAPDHIAIG